MAQCRGRDTKIRLYTSKARNGLRFLAYTWIPFVGLYTEDGYVLRGDQREARRRPTPIPALRTDTPAVCAGQLGVG